MKRQEGIVFAVIFLILLFGVLYASYRYADIDNDGLTRNEEKKCGTDIHNPDTDGDGLKDGNEVKLYHTDPNNNDTDGDKIPDGMEISYNMNPKNADDAREDWDNDLFDNRDEILNYTGAILDPDIPVSGDSDGDNDFICRGIEIEKGLNPDDSYSYGGVHDFLRVFVYPGFFKDENVSMKDFLDAIPYVEPSYWNDTDGGGYSANKYLKISMADPLFRYYADRVNIEWENDPVYGKTGHLKLGNEDLFMEYGRYNTSRSFAPPVYYLTHGRKGVCSESAIANDCIFQYKGYPSTLVSVKTSSGSEHACGEVIIDGATYICNYNSLLPLEDKKGESTYEKNGWTPESSYDPNWFLNGTDIHM
ncbi:MAG: hypothetical protein FE043_00895 [Thermoplasmata archaeon]|nr:MAG: hypothetical protein FE043_00895 [Thermoplasmata archaeon]